MRRLLWCCALTVAACSTQVDGCKGVAGCLPPSFDGGATAGDAQATDDASATTPPCVPENLDPKPTSNTGIPGAPLESPWGDPACDPVHPVHCAYPWPSMWHLP